jgi:RND family efflux transporter MFP subunit
MKKFFVIVMIAAGSILISCSQAKEKKTGLTELKAKLEKLKKERSTLEADIRKVEEEIAKADPAAAQQVLRLVAVDTVKLQDFTHYIELQGRVDAEDVVTVMPRTTMGLSTHVNAVYVKRGDMVQKGQLLAKLDDAVMLEQLEGLKTQLAYAENIYNRQKNLWDQGIGTEVQLITAKNNVDALNKQIATLQENWKTSFVYAPVSGIANEVNIKTGEIYGANPAVPPIQIVNLNSMKVVTEVPENYQNRVNKGSELKVSVPDINKEFKAVIKVTGASINPNTRGFITEAKIPSDPALRVNQVAQVKIEDYTAKNAVVVPVNLVQSDEKGKYVFVMVKEGDKMLAKKKAVAVGESYNGLVEIKSGLNSGDQIITEGYQLVYDGQAVATSSK